MKIHAKIGWGVGLCIGALICGPDRAPAAPPEPDRAYAPDRSYAVVVSQETLAEKAWAEVVQTLRDKYDADLVVYPRGRMEAIQDPLKRIFPCYVCFVATPEEADRMFVVRAHRLTRRLDDDPYTDAIWGILTGYEAADALRIARLREPLVVRRAASSMGPGTFQDLEGGFASSETQKNIFWWKEKGGEVRSRDCAPDAIRDLVEFFNRQAPDAFTTSGHASEKDWQAYYNIRGGEFRCQNGQLYGLDSDGRRYDILSPRPKIYLPAGNCLIGHIPDRDCMTTAWIHTGGVCQMFGYTAATFYGYMGWGINAYFGHPWTLAEAFYCSNQALLYELHTRFPAQASIDFESYGPQSADRMAQQHTIQDKDLMGYLWDRDIVALYGDPAWAARWPREPDWRYTVDRKAEDVTVTVEALADGAWPDRPVLVPFSPRLGDVRGLACEGADIQPVVTDNFLLLPLNKKPRKNGDRIVVRFGARVLSSPPTSAKSDAIRATATPGAEPAPEPQSAQRQIPAQWARQMVFAIQAAGANRENLMAMLSGASDAQRDHLLFLVANMPIRDLQTLSPDYLTNTVHYAEKARAETPWGRRYDDATFRNYVLPYASITEPREDWRPMFYEKLMPLVKECATAGEAAVKLNQAVPALFKVRYDIKLRPRPDQAPLESIRASVASCSGLSVLIVDACRAVGIPARIAGIAQWNADPNSGNHTWIEVRGDDGQWYAMGAGESNALNSGWFIKNAAGVDASNPLFHIYATCFERQPLRFPIAWNPYADYVSATDRTEFYRKLGTPPPKDEKKQPVPAEGPKPAP